ncbi:MAG: transcriptional repressor [Bacteroidota bacterium]
MKRRNTPAKRAILALLTRTGKAMSEDAIEKEIDLSINRATIYRILNQFCEDGIVHRIIAEDGKQYFAAPSAHQNSATIKHHFHFRCLRCQTMECLPTSVDFRVPEGYRVQDANCVLSGICGACSE